MFLSYFYLQQGDWDWGWPTIPKPNDWDSSKTHKGFGNETNVIAENKPDDHPLMGLIQAVLEDPWAGNSDTIFW